MRSFSAMAVALPIALFALSSRPASAQAGVAYWAADGVHCYGGYVSTGDRCVPAAVYYGHGGYAQGGGHYQGGGGYHRDDGYYQGGGGYHRDDGYYQVAPRRRPRNYYSYDGAHCYYPYVSVGTHCVRAY